MKKAARCCCPGLQRTLAVGVGTAGLRDRASPGLAGDGVPVPGRAFGGVLPSESSEPLPSPRPRRGDPQLSPEGGQRRNGLLRMLPCTMGRWSPVAEDIFTSGQCHSAHYVQLSFCRSRRAIHDIIYGTSQSITKYPSPKTRHF